MKNIYVCKLNDRDHFSVNGGRDINLNDNKVFNYTLWHKNKRHLYQTRKRFTSEAIDLFYISLMVFCADKLVKRSNEFDVWSRTFDIYMPVINVEKWILQKNTLEKALNYLTGDHWTFHFRSRGETDDENNYVKGRYHFRKSIKIIDTDVFCMLSGGLDSFIGAINLLKEGKKPIFVGNYNGGKGVSVYQRRVIDKLTEHFGVNPNRFYQFYAAPKGGKEDTTRSRSMMFFAHAILIASGMGHVVNLCIPENGVISLNIPLTVHRIGSLSTRTTHPYYIGLLQEILDGQGIPVTLYNPFQFMTKGEMMANCADQNFLKENYKYTMSCSHPDLSRWRGEQGSKHCGTCLPCTIRRAAIMRAGYDDDSVYGDPDYNKEDAQTNLFSYKLGLAEMQDSNFAIHQNGKLKGELEKYAGVYERGMAELKAFVDTK